MAATGPFRALSIDLWFTTFYHGPDDMQAWDAARASALCPFLRRRAGPPVTQADIASAYRAVVSDLGKHGLPPVTVPPETILGSLADRLGVEVAGPAGEAVRVLATAGLRERPPKANPDAEALLGYLEAHGVPTVLVTNSSRPGYAWSEFLRSRPGPRFRHVVSSCDLGVAKPDPQIFREAARLLGLSPAELLHVGDRWELDVVGALAAGCGAALYRGLWAAYPAGMYAWEPAPPPEAPGVRVLDHLDPLLDPALWTA